ncbi:MAG: ester cyclase [Deltaproteobacteria bacterium]|nr:ester cyclase [Deltaproteobacteria bacterium]
MPADNKALVRRSIEFVNEHKRLPLELYAATYVYHLPSSSNVLDLARVIEIDAMFHAAFPDLHFTLEDIVAEGDKVAYRYTVRGTHMGDFMGLAATGKQILVTGTLTTRIADGKFQEDWENIDMLGLMQQLGVIPQLAQVAS